MVIFLMMVFPEDKIRTITWGELREQAVRTRDQLLTRFPELPPAQVDREIRHKALVVAAGGGGGSGYIYLGAFAELERWGFRPSLLAGTSMGSILGLFRAVVEKFDHGLTLAVLRNLSWSKLFRLISMKSRYGLPAALRLHLRDGIGHHFQNERGLPLSLKDLPIPTIITVSGIRRGALPRPVSYYENLLGPDLRPTPWEVKRKVASVIDAYAELTERPGRLETVYLGLDEGTSEFDAIDAAGFSSALPGVIHYDLMHQDPRMSDLLDTLFHQRDIFRLVDGGLVDNVPAQAAWRAVQRGTIGTRNAFVLALDGFSPKLSTPMWLPLQRIVAAKIQESLSFAHHYVPFARQLSPLELVPNVRSALAVLERGRHEMLEQMPFISRMLKPLPAF
ncbi:MAG: patatin-like phospholipase family protein [Myxococcales bacterium]